MKYASALYEDTITWLSQKSHSFITSVSPPTFSKYFNPRNTEDSQGRKGKDDSALSRYYSHISSKRPKYSTFYKNTLKANNPTASTSTQKKLPNAIKKVQRRNLQQDENGQNGEEEETPIIETNAFTILGNYRDQAEIYTNILSETPVTPMVMNPFNAEEDPNKFCLREGVKTTTKLTTYICNETEIVTEEVHNERNTENAGTCKTVVIDVESCWCPQDYYGRYCESFQGIACSNYRITPQEPECEEEYNLKYRNRMGYPPCRKFNLEGEYNFSFTLDCAAGNLDDMPNAEGVKMRLLTLFQEEIVSEPTEPTPAPVFQYKMDTPEV